METINPYKRFQGAFIPNAMMECRGLSQSAKLMWARLAQYAGRDGRCFPSVEKLGDDIGLSRSAARKVLAELQEGGFIAVKHATGKDRLMHKTSEYFFLNHRIFRDNKVSPGESKNGPSLECPKTTTRQPKNGPSLDSPKMDPPIEENHLRESEEKTSLSEQSSDGGDFSSFGETNEKRPKKNHGSAEDYKLAKDMFESIRVVNALVKKPNWDRWANTIRLMREQDGLTHGEVWRVFRFANRDQFWGNNVLSPESLRRHFPKLAPRAGLLPSVVRGVGADVGESPEQGMVCGQCEFAGKGKAICGGRDADKNHKACDLFTMGVTA